MITREFPVTFEFRVRVTSSIFQFIFLMMLTREWILKALAVDGVPVFAVPSQWYDMFMRSAKIDQELLKFPAQSCWSPGDKIRNDVTRMRGPDFQVLPETLLNTLEYKYGRRPPGSLKGCMRPNPAKRCLIFIAEKKKVIEQRKSEKHQIEQAVDSGQVAFSQFPHGWQHESQMKQSLDDSRTFGIHSFDRTPYRPREPDESRTYPVGSGFPPIRPSEPERFHHPEGFSHHHPSQCKRSDQLPRRKEQRMDPTFMGRPGNDYSEEFQTQAFSGSRPPVGLTNLGNTCYMNSVVQCLLRVQPLTTYLFSDECHRSRNPTNPKGSGCIVLDAYCDLAKEVLTARGKIAPVALKKAIGRCNDFFSGHDQRDANECLLILLDLLHEDLNQAPGALQPDFDFTPYNGMELHHVLNESIISHLFHGITKSHLNHINPFIFWQLPK
jgi:hypothetical protein